MSEEYFFLDENNSLDAGDYSECENIYPVKTIKVDKGFYTAYELKRKYDKAPSLVILDSDFQRDDVWKLRQRRELIESVLMGLPLPIFYFNEDKYGRLIVIDGRQRLSALFCFMNNGFALDKLKVLSDLDGKKFGELPPLLQSKIEDYQIIAHVIKPPTPDRIKFDIFDRVNRAGTQLNKQEIRNALYQGKSTELLNRLCQSEEFNLSTDYSFKKDKRMKNRYLLLRFISFYMYYDGLFNKYIYSGDIDELLGKAMECINSLDDNSVYDIENICKRSLRQINYYIDTDAFRLTDVGDDGKLKRFPVNINIFETLMLLMIHVPYCDYDVKDKLAGRICELKSSEEFRQLLNNNRDGAVKTKKRYEMIMKIAGEISD